MLDQIIENIKKEIKVDSEGKGVCTFRGVARLAGVDESTVRKGCGDNQSKLAIKLTAKGFQVRTFSDNVPDLAVAVICEYYTFDAGKRCTTEAKLAYQAFAAIGVRAWMQDITGYQKQTSTQLPDIGQIAASYILETPGTWECRYPDEFWEQLERVFGMKQGNFECAFFINRYIYKWFPKEVTIKLNEVNPLFPDMTSREHRQHQFFDYPLMPFLLNRIRDIMSVLKMVESVEEFKTLVAKFPSFKNEAKIIARINNEIEASQQYLLKAL